MLASRRSTRKHHAAGDPHLVPGFQEMEQLVEVHTGRRAGMKGGHPPVTFSDNFHQLTQTDAVRIGEDKVDDVVSVDGDGVGQPRTGDPRAAWTLWQPQARSIEFRRTPYPVEETMAAIKACGLPLKSAQRLSRGV